MDLNDQIIEDINITGEIIKIHDKITDNENIGYFKIDDKDIPSALYELGNIEDEGEYIDNITIDRINNKTCRLCKGCEDFIVLDCDVNDDITEFHLIKL